MTDLINLDTCVINALDLFIQKGIASFDVPNFKRPLVVGSGNAAVTGRMIFEKHDAVFADESTYETVLEQVPEIDGALLISASGGKHAPIIAKKLKKKDIPTILLTNNDKALAASEVTKTIVLPKQAEPYTYNTSTYLSMILSYTKENPQNIKQYILDTIAPAIPPDLSFYDAFYVMVPNRFNSVREMFLTKFDELFGPKISGRVFTEEQTQHAKTVVSSDTELFIGLGVDNTTWGTRRINFSLPASAHYGAVIAIGYYIIGHIQKQNEPFFKNNIEAYTKKVSALFGQTIVPFVS